MSYSFKKVLFELTSQLYNYIYFLCCQYSFVHGWLQKDHMDASD